MGVVSSPKFLIMCIFFKFLIFTFSPILGYTPAIKGQLLHVDATTSMQYRTLLEAEMLAVSLESMMICAQAYNTNLVLIF